MKEDYVTFESLGIKYPPYIDEYREKFGEYPTMQLYREGRLPVKFSGLHLGGIPVKSSHFTTQVQFEVMGTLAPPGALGSRQRALDTKIVIRHPRMPSEVIILPWQQLVTKMYVAETKALLKPKRKAWVKL
jgi:hypothetical protein